MVIISIYLICLMQPHAEKKKRGEEILHFTTWPRTSIRNPAPGVNKIYNFGRPFLGHHYDTLSFADLCLGVKNFFLKEIMHFPNMTCMVTP